MNTWELKLGFQGPWEPKRFTIVIIYPTAEFGFESQSISAWRSSSSPQLNLLGIFAVKMFFIAEFFGYKVGIFLEWTKFCISFRTFALLWRYHSAPLCRTSSWSLWTAETNFLALLKHWPCFSFSWEASFITSALFLLKFLWDDAPKHHFSFIENWCNIRKGLTWTT